MEDAAVVDVLIVAATNQRGRVDRLTQLLADRKRTASSWPSEVDDDETTASLSIADASQKASIVLLLADQGFASGRLGDRSEVTEALTKAADRLMIVIIDEPGRSSLSLPSMDVYPTRGVLVDLDEAGRVRALERVVMELAAELDRTVEPQPARLFDEYRLLFESTDRLVQRRRETTQVFFAVNAALSAVIAFFVKDLALSGPRLSLTTVPLFIMGMVASILWRRTIEQYAGLIDWRYRQIRRMERRAFVGSYRAFSREWDWIYAPRRPGAFGFSTLESAVPTVFLVLHALGMCFAIAALLGLLERLGL